MKKFRLSSAWVAAGVFLGAAGALRADPVSLPDLRRRHADAARELQLEQRGIAAATADLDRLSEEIQKAKRKQKRSSRSWLSDYRLQSLLQEAQRVSGRLQKLVERTKELAARYDRASADLAAALDREVEILRGIVNRRGAPAEERVAAAKEIESLSWERMRIITDRAPERLPAHAGNLLANGDTPEEAAERLKAIADFEQRIAREIEAIESELREARRQRFLRTEVAHLMEEEAFFDERAFVRAGPSRREGTSAAAVSRASVAEEGPERAAENPGSGGALPAVAPLAPGAPKDPTTATAGKSAASATGAPAADTGPAAGAPSAGSAASLPAASGPTATDTGPGTQSVFPPPSAGSQIAAPATAPTGAAAAAPDSVQSMPAGGRIGSSSLAAEPPKPEVIPRDPLALLATEFGIPPAQARELTARAPRSSLDEQIGWLERRLQAARRISSLLQEKAQKIRAELPN